MAQEAAFAHCRRPSRQRRGVQRESWYSAGVLTLRCTQRLVKRIGAATDNPPPSTTRLGDWRAQAGTIRTRLLKVAAVVVVSVRRIAVSLSSVFPLQHVFARALRNIQTSPRPG
jgi:hypothetical protein